MNKFIKQSFFNLTLLYLGVLLGFFNSVYRAKLITAEEIGLIALFLSLGKIISIVLLLGSNNAFLKFFPDYQKTAQSRTAFLKKVFFIPLVLFIVFALTFPLQKNFLENQFDPLFSKYVIFLIPFVLLETINSFFDMVLRVNFKSNIGTFINNTLDKIIHLAILLALLVFKFSFETYFYLYLSIWSLKAILLVILGLYHYQPQLSSNTEWSLSFYKKVLPYSLFMLIAGINTILLNQLDKIMLGKLANLEELGIYSIAVLFAGLLNMIATSTSKVAFPRISLALKDEDKNELYKIYKHSSDIQMYLGGFALIIFAFTGKILLGYIGEIFTAGFISLLILASGQLINLSTGMNGGLIILSRYYKFNLYSQVIMVALNFTLNYFLIPVYGIKGAALATAISLSLLNVIKWLFVKVKFHLQPFDHISLKIIAVFILTYALGYFLKRYIDFSTIPQVIGFAFIELVFFLLMSKIFRLYFISLQFLKSNDK